MGAMRGDRLNRKRMRREVMQEFDVSQLDDLWYLSGLA